MAIAGCLYRCVKSGIYAIAGNADKAGKEIDKAVEALRRPTFSEVGEDILDVFDD